MLGRFLATDSPTGRLLHGFQFYHDLPWISLSFHGPWSTPGPLRPRSGLGKKPAASARSEKMTDPSRRKSLLFFFWTRWTKTSMG